VFDARRVKKHPCFSAPSPPVPIATCKSSHEPFHLSTGFQEI
jgi:hypothetical protein